MDLQIEYTEKTLPIPIHARCRCSYTKPLTITAAKKRNRECNIDRNSDNNVGVNRSQSQLHNPYTDYFFCAETIPTFKNCSKQNPENYDKKVNLDNFNVTLICFPDNSFNHINLFCAVIFPAIQVNFLVIVFWVFLLSSF